MTGADQALAHPNLVCDVAIGQSTGPTQRVLGNLFYRGLVLLRQVFVGDTLRTRTEVVALKQNRPRADGTASGLAVLRIQTHNQRGEPVLDFWRCPMIPLRDGSATPATPTASTRSPSELDLAEVAPRSRRTGDSTRCGRSSRASASATSSPGPSTRSRAATRSPPPPSSRG